MTHPARRIALSACLSLAGLASAQPVTPTEPIVLLGPDTTELTGFTGDFQSRAHPLTDTFSLEDGILSCTGEPLGVIRTTTAYRDYSLTFDWRWTGDTDGNSGLLFHGTRPRQLAGVFPASIEAQLKHNHAGDFHMLGQAVTVDDDLRNPEPGGRVARMLADHQDIERPLGEWNTMRVDCRGDTARVFVNGLLVNEGHSATAAAGVLAWQSEGTPIDFRNIVLHPLPPEPVALFNGSDLAGWTADLQDDDATIDDAWSVADGVLRCAGQPRGVLRTQTDHADYTLDLEWRWPDNPGNSGLLIHCSSPRELSIWPKSLEVQLGSGNAGDFWAIGEDATVPADQMTDGRRRLNLTDDSEKPAGQWNHMRVIAAGDNVAVYVNGDLVNQGTDLTATRGAISLQSEGAPIEFRRVELTPNVE